MKSLSIQQDRREILQRLQSINPSSTRVWGQMTVEQMVCHLNDAFRMFMNERQVTDGPAWYPRSIMKWIALWAPVPWPRGFTALPELDQHEGGTPPAGFESDMRALHELIDRFCLQPRDFEFQSHPHFGRMSEREWMRLAYLHTDHHLRQFGA